VVKTVVATDGSTKGPVGNYEITYQPQKQSEQSAVTTRREAAFILQEYINYATGCSLTLKSCAKGEVLPAGVKRIFVGDSEYVETKLANFSGETYLMQADGDNLILAGNDSPGDPWNMTPGFSIYTIGTPTLHAVSRFLEKFVGARWYWPGVPGQFGVKDANLRGQLDIPRSLSLTDKPTSDIREIVTATSKSQFTGAGFSDSFAAELKTRRVRWMRLNRLGVFDRVWHQHYWWYLMPSGRYSDPATNKLNPEHEKF
jgi:hypothetical protein